MRPDPTARRLERALGVVASLAVCCCNEAYGQTRSGAHTDAGVHATARRRRGAPPELRGAGVAILGMERVNVQMCRSLADALTMANRSRGLVANGCPNEIRVPAPTPPPSGDGRCGGCITGGASSRTPGQNTVPGGYDRAATERSSRDGGVVCCYTATVEQESEAARRMREFNQMHE